MDAAVNPQDLTKQGDPAALTCRHCGATRRILRFVDKIAFRVCRNCDAPGGRKATWDQS